MTDLYGIVIVFGGLFLSFYLGWVTISILWNLCSKTSNFIDSLFHKPTMSQTEVMLQNEIYRINQEYLNLVEEHKKSQFETSKMMY